MEGIGSRGIDDIFAARQGFPGPELAPHHHPPDQHVWGKPVEESQHHMAIWRKGATGSPPRAPHTRRHPAARKAGEAD
jgi:hypothetical protein